MATFKRPPPTSAGQRGTVETAGRFWEDACWLSWTIGLMPQLTCVSESLAVFKARVQCSRQSNREPEGPGLFPGLHGPPHGASALLAAGTRRQRAPGCRLLTHAAAPLRS